MKYETFVSSIDNKANPFEFYVNFEDGSRVVFLTNSVKKVATMDILEKSKNIAENIEVAKNVISGFVPDIEITNKGSKIKSFDIRFGQKESIRFDASYPVNYKPTNECWLKFRFDDDIELRFYTLLGGETQKLELTGAEVWNGKAQNNQEKLEEIKKLLIEQGWNPVFCINNEEIKDFISKLM